MFMRHSPLPPDPTHEYYKSMRGSDTADTHTDPSAFECGACRREIAETAEVCTECARKLDGDYERTAALVR